MNYNIKACLQGKNKYSYRDVFKNEVLLVVYAESLLEADELFIVSCEIKGNKIPNYIATQILEA